MSVHSVSTMVVHAGSQTHSSDRPSISSSRRSMGGWARASESSERRVKVKVRGIILCCDVIKRARGVSQAGCMCS